MKKTSENVVNSEIIYMASKIAKAKKAEKESICHYSSLYRTTLNELQKNGIKMDGLGQHNYRLYVPAKGSVGEKYVTDTLKEVKDDFILAEFNYVIEKIRLAKDKGTICHYSYLQTPTLKKLAVMGIKYDALGKHGYRFYYPEKKSKAWYRLVNYGKVKRNADGSFAKKTA